ncbi:acyltransferase family protein [Kitasatospora sp. NPDC059646]|uniref:acyltransferase family protein n=1 Tax=Kitasatospora sp. NPDC059646 TaxID=3346893 RepID=UPI0036C96FEF
MSFVQSVVRPRLRRPGPAAGDSAGRPLPGTAPRPRLYLLDLLRLLAALGVVLWHYAGYQGWPADVWGGRPGDVIPVLHKIGSYSWIGVELFFLISGFVVCMSCWGKTSGAFFRSRVVRLFPGYWFGVLVAAAVVLAYRPNWMWNGKMFRYSDVLTNLTMVQKGEGVWDVDPVYWTLWVELRFYVLFGVVVAIGLSYKRVVAFCAMWTFASVITTASGGLPLLDLIFFPDYSSFFIAGIAMYLMYRYGQDMLLWGIVGFSWLLAQNKLHKIMSDYQAFSGGPLSYTKLLLLMTLAFAVVAATALGWFRWVKWRKLTVLGALTYPLYLLHQVVGWWFLTHLQGKVGPYTEAGLVIGAMLVAAYLVNRFVEQPGSKLLKRGLEKSFDRMRGIDAREALAKREQRARARHAGEEPQEETPRAAQPVGAES